MGKNNKTFLDLISYLKMSSFLIPASSSDPGLGCVPLTVFLRYDTLLFSRCVLFCKTDLLTQICAYCFPPLVGNKQCKDWAPLPVTQAGLRHISITD